MPLDVRSLPGAGRGTRSHRCIHPLGDPLSLLSLPSDLTVIQGHTVNKPYQGSTEDENIEGCNLMREVCLFNSYINASGISSHKTFPVDGGAVSRNSPGSRGFLVKCWETENAACN